MKLIDTGFLSFKKDRISIWFKDGFFCWMPDVVWFLGTWIVGFSRIWILLAINQLLIQKYIAKQ